MASTPEHSKLVLSTKEDLVRLRDLTARTGMLSEPQALQLRLWPFMVDKDLEKSDADLDLDKKTLRFRWQNPNCDAKWRPSKAYQTRLKRLDTWVKFLLGDDWQVSVLMNPTATESLEAGLVVTGGIAIFPLKEDRSGRKPRRKDSRRTARSSARKARKVNRRR